MQLKNYQVDAVENLLKWTRLLIHKDGSRRLVFKAPTGSGKTIMVAEYLMQLAQETGLPHKFAFLWISSNKLHEQSREKLNHYLRDTRYTLSYLDDVQNDELRENEIVFVNWESLTKRNKLGEYANSYMREQESGRTLTNFVANAKKHSKEVFLIVDESHNTYWSQQTQDFVQQIIAPKLTLDVSATPALEPTAEQLASNDVGYVLVRFVDVVQQGMIKTSVVINEKLGEGQDLLGSSDELVVDAALSKRRALLKELKGEDTPYRPLVLIQLPSSTDSMSALDISKRESIAKYLAEQHDITVENGRLGIWLSNEKENVDQIETPDSPVDVLIFKQAIALGWDCPRAQILIMFRDMRSATFEIQTVGRIMRMPEAKHYNNDQLDRAYVYTNLDRIKVKEDQEAKLYFETKQAFRSEKYKPIDIPSVYLSRLDYGDLTAAFHQCFYYSANDYFGISDKDMPPKALKKVDEQLDLELGELTTAVPIDVIIENLDQDARDAVIGASMVQVAVSADEIKLRYEQFAKASSMPYSPARSHGKIQYAIYQWFDGFLGFKNRSRLDIQRIIVCSENNLRHFQRVMNGAKERYAVIRKKKLEEKRKRHEEPKWNVPAYEVLSEKHELKPYQKLVMQPAYFEPNPSKPEEEFITLVERSSKIAWWYRNGTSKALYLGIPYETPKGDEYTAYPDFVVGFVDGSVGIYETKSGATTKQEETGWKSDAIQQYLAKHSVKKRPLIGGIVDVRPSGLFVFTGKKYNNDTNAAGWERLQV